MATPVETPAPQNGPEGGTGAPESGTPAPEPQAPAGGAPEAPPASPPAHGLPGAPAPDGVITSGRGSNQDAAPQTPAAPAATPSPTEPQGTTTAPAQTPPGGGQQVEDLPDWAQKIIKDARDDAAKTRVNAKTQAADEARKALTNDIAKALGITTDETPAEDQLTPEQLRDLLAGERTTAKMARTELAVSRAAQGGGNFNAAALLDSRAFLDSIKDVDPTDNEALATKIAEAVQAQPWLQGQAAPAVDPAATPGAPAPVTPAAPAAPPAPAPVAVPPSGGQFAGGPGAQPQDLSSMSIDDFRKLRRTPRS